MKRGAFIVIDGIDGAGKSTQLALLKKKLGKRAVFTFDPGGTEIGNTIREILLRGAKKPPFATLLLFLAARAALVEEVIAPARAKGALVVCDRYDSSTHAYQIHAGKHPEFRSITRSLTESLPSARPDAYVILDLDPVRTKARLASAGKSLDVYERKSLSYHRAVRDGFKRFKPEGSKVYFIDADRSEEAVFDNLWHIVKRYAK